MALPLFYEAGRDFAFAVQDGLRDAGAFRPANAIDEWLDFHYGSGMDPFTESENDWPDSAWQVLRRSAKVCAFRNEFEQGYRDGMRETRTDRKREHAEAR
mgnify:CR=1 FL=1